MSKRSVWKTRRNEAQSFPGEFLKLSADGLKTCWELYFGGNTSQVMAILPLYRGQFSTLATSPSPLQQTAAQLASQAWQLTQELAADNEDFDTAQRACQQAILYAHQDAAPPEVSKIKT